MRFFHLNRILAVAHVFSPNCRISLPGQLASDKSIVRNRVKHPHYNEGMRIESRKIDFLLINSNDCVNFITIVYRGMDTS